MKLVLTTSACFDAPTSLFHDLTILPQSFKLRNGDKSIFSDDLHRIKENLNPKHVLRWDPVSSKVFKDTLCDKTEPGDCFVLHPEAKFDTSEYNFLAQSVLYRGGQIHTKALNCYGHALAYLSEAIARFYIAHRPSIDQLNLLVDRLNTLTHVYIVTKRSIEMEPGSAPLLVQWSNLTSEKAVYASKASGWQRCAVGQIKRDIANEVPKGILIWIDSHRGISYTRFMVVQLQKWGLKDKQRLRCHYLNHMVGATLPEQFSLVTLTPDEGQLNKLQDWVLRTV